MSTAQSNATILAIMFFLACAGGTGYLLYDVITERPIDRIVESKKDK